jgi:predicted RNA binding protein YcfA (HicA-like mRNA interferase family)
MNRQELFEELKANPRKVRFARLCKIAEAFGFQTRKGTGSHRVYFREGIQEMLNIQNEAGWAKAYQVRQFIKVIEKYGLEED